MYSRPCPLPGSGKCPPLNVLNTSKLLGCTAQEQCYKYISTDSFFISFQSLLWETMSFVTVHLNATVTDRLHTKGMENTQPRSLPLPRVSAQLMCSVCVVMTVDLYLMSIVNRLLLTSRLWSGPFRVMVGLGRAHTLQHRTTVSPRAHDTSARGVRNSGDTALQSQHIIQITLHWLFIKTHNWIAHHTLTYSLGLYFYLIFFNSHNNIEFHMANSNSKTSYSWRHIYGVIVSYFHELDAHFRYLVLCILICFICIICSV